MTRPRDYAYEALAEVTGTDMTTGRGELNAALKSIRAETEIEDSYILSDVIHERAKLYRQVMGDDVLLTPSALAKHWKRVLEESSRQAAKPQGTNLSAPPQECPTCGGDQFVLVQTRPVMESPWMKAHKLEIKDKAEAKIEEFAPCPNCNAGTDSTFLRYDGTKTRALDPAEVRARMRG